MLPIKLFVGGLSWQTTVEKLKEYFGQFGDITDVYLVKDPLTQRNRGFGFITFSNQDALGRVAAVPSHILDGKKIDPKRATPNKNRVFVGGVSQDCTEDEVKAYFSQFGNVRDITMLMNQRTGWHRGCGFIFFDSEEAVNRVCEIHFHVIKGKKVECKKVIPPLGMQSRSGNVLPAAMQTMSGHVLPAVMQTMPGHVLPAAMQSILGHHIQSVPGHLPPGAMQPLPECVKVEEIKRESTKTEEIKQENLKEEMKRERIEIEEIKQESKTELESDNGITKIEKDNVKDGKISNYENEYIEAEIPKDEPKNEAWELEFDEKEIKVDLYCNVCQVYGHIISNACVVNPICFVCGIQGHVRRDCKEVKKECTKNEEEYIEVEIKKDETKTEEQLKSDNDSIEVGENVMISLNKGSSRGSDAKMKKRKNDCLQNEVQDAKENHAVGEKKKYERKPSQPYCSTCGGNHFEACKGRFCRNCHSHHFDSCPEGSSRGSDAKKRRPNE